MRKFTLFALSLLMAGTAVDANAQSKAANGLRRFNNAKRNFVAVHSERQAAKSATAAKFEKAGFGPSSVSYSPTQAGAGDEPIFNMKSHQFGYIEGPDKTTWTYTQSIATRNDWYYDKTEIVVYDNTHKERGRINIQVPQDKVVNVIEPFGQITTKFFDKNDKTLEIPIYYHEVPSPGVTIDSTFAYNMNSEKVAAFKGVAQMTESVKNSWDVYQRLLLTNNYIGEDTSYIQVDIYKPGGWNNTTPELEHTFTIDFEKVSYSDGPAFHAYDVEGTPYYLYTHYEKPWASGYDFDFDSDSNIGLDPIPTENNFYVIETFDRNFNRIDSLAIPLTKAPDALWPAFASFGTFSYNDLTKGYFTGDDKLNYTVTLYDYIKSDDSNRFRFEVYSEGKHVNTICDYVTDTWFPLSSINGQSDQYAFIQTIGSDQFIQMVDMPSCEKKTRIPSSIEGNKISADINRAPVGDSYQYVIKMAYAEGDADKNVIALLGWYTTDLKLDHFTKFNLGPNAQYFTPLLNDDAMNPYTFDTDDEHEYCFIAKIKRDNSTVLDNVVVVAKENGEFIRKYSGDDEYKMMTSAILDNNTSRPEFIVGYMNNNTGEYSIDFYPLPFNKFAKGGDGTENNPYLISTAGDMKQIEKAPKAAYKLAADIDMSNSLQTWKPIDTFGGILDGDGHKLMNLTIDDNNGKAGLFRQTEEGTQIKNIIITDPTLVVNPQTTYAGFVAGATTKTSITDIHVYGARIEGNGSTDAIGGLIGQGTTYTAIASSSFNGVINLPETSVAGGIVGNMRTGTTADHCAATGTFTAANTLGGIVGETERDANVTNCRVDAAIKAQNTVGGIVGVDNNKGLITNCIANGTIDADAPTRWGKFAVGGIAGELVEATDVTGNIMNAEINVTAEPNVTTDPDTGAEIDLTAKAMKSVHRIAGYTIVNAAEDAGGKAEDKGFAKNYATTAVKWNDAAVEYTDDTTSEGATKSVADLTTDFLKGIGFEYGNTAAEPWKEAGKLPVLYFENIPMSLTLSQSAVNVVENESIRIVATLYGADPSMIDVVSSDNSVAEAEIVEEGDNSITIEVKCKKTGTATITATVGTLTATCLINGVTTAIDGITADGNGPAITFRDGNIVADGASRISVYNINGQLAADNAGSTMSTSGMSKGVYVIVATDTAGHTATSKIVLK